jgi:hypothetical protein
MNQIKKPSLIVTEAKSLASILKDDVYLGSSYLVSSIFSRGSYVFSTYSTIELILDLRDIFFPENDWTYLL